MRPWRPDVAVHQTKPPGRCKRPGGTLVETLTNQNIGASGAMQPYSDLPEQNAAPTTARLHKVTRQLDFFALRCIQLADRVATGELKFLDAVDLAYSAAIWAELPNAIEASGLIDTKVISGDDVVQATLAAAFANARRPA